MRDARFRETYPPKSREREQKRRGEHSATVVIIGRAGGSTSRIAHQ